MNAVKVEIGHEVSRLYFQPSTVTYFYIYHKIVNSGYANLPCAFLFTDKMTGLIVDGI